MEWDGSTADQMLVSGIREGQTNLVNLVGLSFPGLWSVLWSKQILLHILFISVCFHVMRRCNVRICCRKRESFLQRFEKTAPGPLASSGATHTSCGVSQRPHNMCVNLYVLSHVLFIYISVCALRTHLLHGSQGSVSHICGCEVGD